MSKLAINGGQPVRSQPYPSWPQWDGDDEQAVVRALHSGNWGGYPPPSPETAQFERAFASYHDCREAVTLASGTGALMLALRVAGIGYGDEVIVPALTFVASASCVLLVGATPVFADVDPDTYCLKTSGPGSIEDVVTANTRAIIPVHLGSRISDMTAISRFAEARDIAIIEDCAHMHGGAWDGRGVGSWSRIAAFSFQASKLLTAGEGGLIVTQDESLAEKARYFINSGRLGPADPVRHQVLGWSMRATEFQGALLRTQFERMIRLQAPVRERNKAILHDRLADLPGIEVLRIDERETRRSGYAYIFKYLEASQAGVPLKAFVGALRAEGIPCSGSVYEPVYRNILFPLTNSGAPLYQPHLEGKVDYRSCYCPNAEQAAAHENVWIFHEVFLGSEEDTLDIARAVEKVMTHIDELSARAPGRTRP